VAGRGPVAAIAAGDATVEPPALAASRRRPPRPTSARIAAAGAVVVVAVILAWAIWQPEASDRATNRALELIEERDYEAAIAKTEDAADANPLSADPLLVRAVAEAGAGRETVARRTLGRAVLDFPGDPQTWLRLASFQLDALDRPRQALETVRGVLYLDPFSRPGGQLFLDARARLRQKEAAAVERSPAP
jgi:tetratricopeptide (TPR) repeat protein